MAGDLRRPSSSSRPTALLLAVLAWVLLTGCVTLRPEASPEPVATGAETPDRFQQSAVGPESGQDPGPNPDGRVDKPWWRDFNDPELNKLIDRIMARNPDLRQAAARITEARARLVQARSGLFPSLNLEASAAKGRSSAAVLRPGVDRSTTSYGLNLTAGYQPDLFGGTRAVIRATRAELARAAENKLEAERLVVAEAVRLHLQLAGLRLRLAVAERRTAALGDSLELVEGRYRRGLTSVLDVRQARRVLAQARTSIPAIQREGQRIGLALAVLAGDYPRAEPLRAVAGPRIELTPVPVGLPSELLARRPDIRAAREALTAQRALIGQAEANRWPALTLSGRLGVASDELSELVQSGSDTWTLSLGVSAPIFDAGRRRAGVDEARAALVRLTAAYAQAALAAFREVEEALLSGVRLAEQRVLIEEALVEAKATEESALASYSRGLNDYLRVLDAQTARYQLEDEAVQTYISEWTNRVDLYRALGGGFSEPGEAPPR